MKRMLVTLALALTMTTLAFSKQIHKVKIFSGTNIQQVERDYENFVTNTEGVLSGRDAQIMENPYENKIRYVIFVYYYVER